MADQRWTLDELADQVAEALTDSYSGAPSARVRDVPDTRTIRWYTTRGLVDPPLATRGRQALYGRRHLLQLVALKRRQAEGVPLAVIQTELAGLPDTALAAIAALPHPATGDSAPPSQPATDDAFSPPPLPSPSTPLAGARGRFWTTPPSRPAPPPTQAPIPGPVTAPPPPAAIPPVTAAMDAAPPGDLPGTVRGIPDVLHGFRLAPGVVLLLEADVAATAHPLDAAALRAAAVPLLALLHRSPTHERLDPTDDAHRTATDEGTRR